MGQERRKETRHNVVITVEITCGTSLSLQACENLSGGGAFFRHAIPFKVGTTVTVRFTLPGERRDIQCQGEVANVPIKGSYGMGVKFLGLSDDERQRINKFAEQYAEPPPIDAVEVVEDEPVPPAPRAVPPPPPVEASAPASAPAPAPAPALAATSEGTGPGPSEMAPPTPGASSEGP